MIVITVMQISTSSTISGGNHTFLQQSGKKISYGFMTLCRKMVSVGSKLNVCLSEIGVIHGKLPAYILIEQSAAAKL